jgi:hypothetical protein
MQASWRLKATLALTGTISVPVDMASVNYGLQHHAPEAVAGEHCGFVSVPTTDSSWAGGGIFVACSGEFAMRCHAIAPTASAATLASLAMDERLRRGALVVDVVLTIVSPLSDQRMCAVPPGISRT